MTRFEAEKIAEAIGHIDHGCTYCVHEMLLNFPEHKCIVLSHGLKLGVIRGQSDTAVDE
jgi:hypothetical protein